MQKLSDAIYKSAEQICRLIWTPEID